MIIIGEPLNLDLFIEVTDENLIKELHEKGIIPRYRLGRKVWFYKKEIKKGGVNIGAKN